VLRSGWEGTPGEVDPAVRTSLAHETAFAVLHAGRDTDTPTERLVDLVDGVGIEALADLWRASAPNTLPGTMWALYLLQTWLQRHGDDAARAYSLGRATAEVADVVAGVADPPGPDEVAAAGDAILTSAFDGDFAVALERAAAFCRVVSAGRLAAADVADDLPDDDEAGRLTRLASGSIRMAEQLEAAARLWRVDALR